MVWLGMLIGGMIGATLAIAFHCMIIIGKEADNREYSNVHTIK